MTEKKSYGAAIIDHESKNLGPEDDVREYRKLIEREKVQPILIEAINKALAADQFKNKNFYISLIIKIEKIGVAPRFYAVPRLSCPTPHWRMSAFKYHFLTSQLEFLFALPDEQLGLSILEHPHAYLDQPNLGNLVKFVHLFNSGELLSWVKKENKEEGPLAIIQYKES